MVFTIKAKFRLGEHEYSAFTSKIVGGDEIALLQESNNVFFGRKTVYVKPIHKFTP